jgi:hypothetical protein
MLMNKKNTEKYLKSTIYRRFGRIYWLNLQGWRVKRGNYQIIQRHILEYSNLRIHRRHDLKFYKNKYLFIKVPLV